MSRETKRLVVYGDVHGCLDEWKTLRGKVSPLEDDLEITVGDLIDRGPDSPGCLRFARENRISSVLGNHEFKYLRYSRHYKKFQETGKTIPMKFPDDKMAVFRSLAPADLEFIAELPFFLRKNNLLIVHAGVSPSLEVGEITPKDKLERLTWIRELNAELNPVSLKSKDGVFFWAEKYDGGQGFIVCGHNPFPEVRRDAHSLAIDTGCAFGGKLTAAIFEQAPAGGWNTDNVEFMQVPALQKYSELMIED
ncbi:MAG: metallophosphoesterase [Candidatus Ozemobacteraceae bacterium]